jgi:TolB protein
MKIPPRELLQNQLCQIWIHDVTSGDNVLLFETNELLLEAPNWALQGDALILNGRGVLWQLAIAEPKMQKIEISAVPPLNNDHVLDPDGEHIFLSAYDDWQLYRALLKGGTAVRITGQEGPKGSCISCMACRLMASVWHLLALRPKKMKVPFVLYQQKSIQSKRTELIT